MKLVTNFEVPAVTLSRGGVRAMLCPMSTITRYTIGEDGKTTFGDDGTKSYTLRRGRGLSTVAPVLRFSRRKPKYRRVGNVLVMCRTAR
jgi:hypothetical protein